jgi:hypothetical protein
LFNNWQLAFPLPRLMDAGGGGMRYDTGGGS